MLFFSFILFNQFNILFFKIQYHDLYLSFSFSSLFYMLLIIFIDLLLHLIFNLFDYMHKFFSLLYF